MKAYDQKMGAKDFASSQHTGHRDIVSGIKDNEGVFKNDRRGMLEAISNMSPDEQKRYRNEPQFKSQVDQAVAHGLSNVPPDAQERGEAPGGPAYDAAKRMLENVSNGKEPKQDIVTKVAAEASDFKTDKAQVMRDVQQAFKEDPTLRDRLNNPKTPEDRKVILKSSFNGMMHSRP